MLGPQMGVDLTVMSGVVGFVTETITNAIIWITGNS
jgi:hypothetical protein